MSNHGELQWAASRILVAAEVWLELLSMIS
jgi:hypothetical protein